MIFQKFGVILMFSCTITVMAQFVYLNNGVFKFISGIALPIDVEMSGGSLSWFSNVQAFYKLPDNISYFEPYRVIQKRSIKNIFNRPNLYEALIKYFDRLGFYGNECIYRLICEVASQKINQKENGLLGEIVQILFSPGNDLPKGLEKYKAAQWQGLYNNSECGLIYKDCYIFFNKSSLAFTKKAKLFHLMATSDCDKKEKSGSDTETDNVSSMLSELSLSSLASHDECFISYQHAEMSLGKMESYFLKEQLTDVVLIAGKRRIPAHRLVLSAGSEYFAAMFTSQLKEASQDEIELHNVDGDALWALMHYCYTGRIELFEDTVETILGTACLLHLTEVVEVCCTFLKKQLHPSNCIGIGLFADSQGCTDLLEVSQNYTAEHFLEVIKSQEFLMLSADEVAKLLASDDLNVSSEETIFHALMSWVEYDLPNRTEHVSKLLSLVKLPLLSPSFIVDHIETIPLFRDKPECRELIVEAFKYHLLPERRLMLQSPRTCPRKSTVGDLYALGGMGANKSIVSVEKYDMRLDKWTHFDKMNFRRLQCGVAVMEGKLYVVGGRDGLKTLNTIECYDIKTKTCTNLLPMSTPRHGLGVAILEGPLYAVGGHDGWSFLNTVERWDPQTKAWSYVTPMSTQRSTVGVAVLNGKLYAVGGRDGSCCLRTVECYDPHTNKWIPCASMAKRRGGVGVGVLNGYLYALGGHEVPGLNPSAPRFSCVERYDPKTDTWSTVASMSCGRDAIGVCVLGEKLFAVGGYDGKWYLKLVEAYDPQKNEWQQVAPLINERAGSCVVVIRPP